MEAGLWSDVVPLDVEAFVRGLIAALVTKRKTTIQPKRAEHRRGFQRIYAFLDREVELARGKNNNEWLRQIIRLRNRLSPGPTGSFDQFETALRDLQLSFTESPNISYEDIEFTISEPFARSILRRMNQHELALVEKAAEAFVEASGS